MKMYNIFISNFVNYLPVIKKIFQIKKDYPQYFKEEISQVGLFGIFPYSIWSSCNMTKNIFNNIGIESNLRYILDENLKLMLEFTNTNLSKEHFFDSFSNYVLKMTDELKLDYSICVSNKDLALFLKEKYNDLKVINANFDKKAFNEDVFTSNIIDFEFFNNNKEEVKNNCDKYVLKLNSFCENECSCKEKMSKAILNFENLDNVCEKRKSNFENSKENKFFVSNEQIVETNISNFVIDLGSTEEVENIDAILYYLAKAEHLAEVKLMLLKQLYLK